VKYIDSPCDCFGRRFSSSRSSRVIGKRSKINKLKGPHHDQADQRQRAGLEAINWKWRGAYARSVIVISVRYQRIRLASLCWQAGSDAQSLSRGTGEGADQHGAACPQAGRLPAIRGEISA
jgi:hypothetical protein